MKRRNRQNDIRPEDMQAFSHGLTGRDAKQAATMAVAQLPANGERCAPGEFQRIAWTAIAAVTKRRGRK